MKYLRVLLVAAIWLAGLIATSVSSAQVDYTYHALDVPVAWGGFTSAYGINNGGTIVGNFVTANWEIDGFVFNKGDYTHVAVAGGPGGALNDVNDLGQAVGSFADVNTGVGHSFVRSKSGEITVLPDAAPGAFLTEATGINNAGVIVGFFVDGDGQAHGFVLRDGKYATYDYPGATRTLFTRINDRGQIVGIWAAADGRRHGFLLQEGALRSIDVPGAIHTRCTGLNNWGEIVGWYVDADLIAHGFLLRGDKFTDIDFPGATDSAALGINDRGVIVGTYDESSRGMIAIPNP
jgi:probable HAF family extracellular repeat protein